MYIITLVTNLSITKDIIDVFLCSNHITPKIQKIHFIRTNVTSKIFKKIFCLEIHYLCLRFPSQELILIKTKKTHVQKVSFYYF